MYVGPAGPRHAKIAIVGEKGGREEARLGQPFVGPTGREVNELLLKSGINRSAVYLTNTVKNFDNFDTPTTAQIQAEQLSLYRELSRMPNLSVIIPMGAVALASLSNFQLDSITSYRGSILKSFIGTKMVPTFHPAFYMRGEWRFKPIVKFDVARALEESYDKEVKLPKRAYCIAETRQDLDAIWHELSTRVEYISFDIELMRGRYIECIAFSKTPDVAYCIPLTNGRRQNYWENTHDEVYAWRTITAILNQPRVKYIAKNGLFDCWHLWRHGVPTLMESGYDVEYMHRLRAPDLPHDLGFLVSIYTREPYYKDESGSWKEQDRTVTDEQFYIYNCKDAACTLEVFHELYDDMKSNGQLEYYKEEVHSQWAAVMDMRCRGIHVDVQALRDVRTKLTDKISSLRANILSSVGWIPNTQSSLDMTKFYDQLGIRYTKTSKGAAKRDKEILFTYAARYPNHRGVLMDIGELNRTLTQLNGFTNMGLDEEEFYHPALTINKTATGRLAGKQADEGGPQIQNIPKSLRKIFIPDNPEQDELSNADLKGAEAMLLAWFTQDPLLVQGFLRKKDIHRIRACVIFRNWTSTELPPDDLLAGIKLVCSKCESNGDKECNHSERYLGKQSGHAMAYLEGVRRFCTELRKQGIFIDENLAKQIRAKVITPHIHQWHGNVETALRIRPWLETPLGRKREFYGLLDQDLLRKALSWLCQATVGQIASRAMSKMHLKLPLIDPTARLLTQTHDSVTITHKRKVRDAVKDLYHEAFYEPMVIGGRELIIPIDITHGPNWGELK
jgi:uracil-DNA glycosylase family 4